MSAAATIARSVEPSDGWDRDVTGEAIEEAAELLLDTGMRPLDVEELLRDIVSAVRSEYGE